MTADDVLEILARLDAASIGWWVDGGWGVDALLGEQTRAHDDLDLAVQLADVARLESVFGEFRHVQQEEWPSAYVLCDERGRQVDFHPLEFDVDGDGRQPQADGSHSLWPRRAFGGVGSIGGRPVRCTSAEFQVASHVYPGHDDVDWDDMRLLCERFELPLPEMAPPGFSHEKRARPR